jgi:hypothetical protein
MDTASAPEGRSAISVGGFGRVFYIGPLGDAVAGEPEWLPIT